MMGTEVPHSGVEEKFSDVRSRRTVSTTRSKIFDDVLAIMSQRTKVVTMSPRCNGKDAIELFDEERRRLVDCAEDGLPEIGESTEETDNTPCTLRIEALTLAMKGRDGTLVGSSKKRRSEGFAQSSTPRVRRFFRSTLRLRTTAS